MTQHAEETIEQAGRLYTYQVACVPLFDQDGEPYGLCGVARDLSGQLEAEAQIREIKQQMWHLDRVARAGMMMSTLVHELSQPLAAVKNNAGAGRKLLGMATPPLTEITGIFDDILRDTGRAAAVISGMRGFLKHRPAADEKVPAAQVIREILDIFKAELLGRTVDLQLCIQHDAEQCVVAIDKSRLQQIFLNILMNAVDAMEGLPASEKKILVSMVVIGNRSLQVILADSGAGIPAEHLERVFEPFWTSKVEGMGLGLPICKAILDEAGGSIRIERNQGRGLSVIISLPLLEPAP